MARRPILSIPQTTSPITFAAFGDLLATDRIAHVLAAAKAITHRQRKLSLVFTAQLCIAMSLWSDESIDDIARKLLDGPRVRGTLRADAIPSAGAICRRRQTLGVAPLQALFTTICRPMATTTADAFRWGMRLMAIDGTTEEVPDTPANSAAFGRASGSRGDGSFPQLQLVYLCEVGTHAIGDVVWGTLRRLRARWRRDPPALGRTGDAAPVGWGVSNLGDVAGLSPAWCALPRPRAADR